MTTISRLGPLNSTISFIFQDPSIHVKNNCHMFPLTGSFNGIPCVAHTLQLVIKDACLNKKEFTALMSKCRRIVGHFKHSSKASKLLKRAQKALSVSEHRLTQDEPTRWNSTYCMMERLLEQRKAVVCVMPDLKSANDLNLTSSEWGLVSSLVEVLKVFYDVTKTASKAQVTISEIIPIVNAIKVSLGELHAVHNTGVKGIINDLLNCLNNRYKDCEMNVNYSLATLLDPRFKINIFTNLDSAASAKATLLAEMKQVASQNDIGESDADTNIQDLQGSTTHKNPVQSLYNKILSRNKSCQKVCSFQFLYVIYCTLIIEGNH